MNKGLEFNGQIVVLLQALAYWPVWCWYAARMLDKSDEPWGIIALLTALIFLFSTGKAEQDTGRALKTAMFGTLLYLICFPFAAPLVRAAIALAGLGCTLSVVYLKSRLHLGIVGLLLLSLPLIASLQFYLGYPVRLATSHLVAQFISLSGFPATAEGTLLRWMGEMVAVDAPCSGIRMLWTGLYLSFTLACFMGLSRSATWLSYVSASIVIFAGNVLRAYLLFYVEAGIVKVSWDIHQALGLLVFAGMALMIIGINKFIRNISLCHG